MNFEFSANNATVVMGGDFTFTDHTVFLDIMKRLFDNRNEQVVMDLSRLDFIDSAGLGMLLIARDEAGKAGRKLILRTPQGQVRRMFAVSKFQTLFAVED